MRKFLNPIEKMPSEEMKILQLERLKNELNYVYNHSAFYQKKFKNAGLLPADLHKLEDLQRFPFTTKQELRENNVDFTCVGNTEIVDIGASTGTTGTPVILPVTKKDWDETVECIMRYVVAIGIEKDDIVQLTVAMDQLFSASTPLDDALKELGVTVVRMGPGNSRKQLEIMKHLGTTVIYATPGFMLILAEEAKHLGIDLKNNFRLNKALLVGQSLYDQDWKSNALYHRVKEHWNVELFSVYGSMETFAGFAECQHHTGHHIYPDRFLMEIIDPETCQSLPPGELGELVFTHLTMEATPFIRLRHGDITKLETTPCPCGRTSPRIMATIGRVDQMLKVRGASVYPEQIENAILKVEGVTAYVIEAFTDSYGSDGIKIKVALNGSEHVIHSEIEKSIKAIARIKPNQIESISIEEARKIWFSKDARKPKKFRDRREKA
jgi:phenylacetate-CoA ligase